MNPEQVCIFGCNHSIRGKNLECILLVMGAHGFTLGHIFHVLGVAYTSPRFAVDRLVACLSNTKHMAAAPCHGCWCGWCGPGLHSTRLKNRTTNVCHRTIGVYIDSSREGQARRRNIRQQAKKTGYRATPSGMVANSHHCLHAVLQLEVVCLYTKCLFILPAYSTLCNFKHESSRPKYCLVSVMEKKLCDPSCDCMQSTHSIVLWPGIHVPGRQKQVSLFAAPFSEVM